MMVFTCQKCGKNELEEVVTGVTRYSTIRSIGTGGLTYEPLDDINDLSDGEVDHYQCKFCGTTLQNQNGETIRDEESLIEWLEENR